MNKQEIKFSVGLKIILPLSLIFLIAMAASIWFYTSHQTQQSRHDILKQMQSMAWWPQYNDVNRLNC